MEFLIVHFPRSRRVKVNDEFNGRTEELIELQAGTHTISLGPPENFAPTEQTITLQDTSELAPMEVAFELATEA